MDVNNLIMYKQEAAVFSSSGNQQKSETYKQASNQDHTTTIQAPASGSYKKNILWIKLAVWYKQHKKILSFMPQWAGEQSKTARGLRYS